MKDLQMLAGTWREWRVVPILAVLAAIPVIGFGQTYEPLTVTGKLHYHAKSTYGPGSILGLAAYAAILQADCAPLEWKEGGEAYGMRVASMVAWSGVHSAQIGRAHV